MTLQDTVPMLLKVSDTIIVFDYDTYEETIKIVESEIFNPNYFLQEKYMRDTIQSIDTIMTFDPNTEREIREIYEVKTPKGIQMLLDYEYGKEVPDFDNLQKYLDMCKKKKIR
jgi:protein-tyrosine-phosphatase